MKCINESLNFALLENGIQFSERGYFIPYGELVELHIQDKSVKIGILDPSTHQSGGKVLILTSNGIIGGIVDIIAISSIIAIREFSASETAAEIKKLLPKWKSIQEKETLASMKSRIALGEKEGDTK